MRPGTCFERPRRVGRRAFLAAAAAPLILPSRVLGRGPGPAPSTRVLTGHIGVGAHGRALLEQAGPHVSAICDVDARALREAAEVAGPGVRQFSDYRDVLDRSDVDAVVIATPDHWHAMQAVHAIEAGKQVFIAAPMARTLGEVDRVLTAARRFDAVVAVGEVASRPPIEAPLPVTVTAPPNPVGGDARPHSTPDGLDWASWVGPAPWFDYRPDLLDGNFRWVMELGGGRLMREGASGLRRALNGKTPRRVTIEATGESPSRSLWNCPPTMRAVFRFEDGAKPIAWVQDAAHGAAPKAGPVALDRWLAAVLTHTPDHVALQDFAAATQLAVVANLAYRVGRPLTWDLARQRFEDDPVAQRLADPLPRIPWP